MSSPHYQSAGYNVEPAEAFPDIPNDQLLGKSDQEIENTVLQAMGLAPSNDVPNDMGQANFQPVGEVDQAALHEYVQELIDRRNVIAIRAGRQKITETLIPPVQTITQEQPTEEVAPQSKAA